MATVYISYKSEDVAIAEALASNLEEMGHRVKYDQELFIGSEWRTHLMGAKCQPTCRIFVILNLLCKYGGFAPKPPRYFYNGNDIIPMRYRLRSRWPSTIMGG